MDETGKRSVVDGPSANERLKDRYERLLAWSTAAAVTFHAALFGWAGFHFVRPLLVEPTPTGGQLLVLPASFAQGTGLEGMATPVTVPEEAATEVDPLDSGGLDGSEQGGSGDSEVMDLWAAATERLTDSRLLRAEVVDLDRTPSSEEGEGEPDSLSIAQLDSAQLLADLAHGDSLDLELDLERLTEIRPELAVMIPSMWILLRNPTEVESFLRRSYGRWALDRSQPGSVTVTVWIDTKGSVEWAEVSRSSGRNNLDEAALALFNEVVAFRPARQEGVPISGSATFALLFPW